MGKVVDSNLYLLHAVLSHAEVSLDELVQFLLVGGVAEEHQLLLQPREQPQELLELLRLVVGWGDVPVEVVLGEHVHHLMVWHEGYLLGIERTEKGRWQLVLVGAGLADGEDELYERFQYVVRCALLGFRPEQVFGFEELRTVRRHSHGKVNFADNLCGVVGGEPVCRHFVLQFLLQNVAVK